MIVFSIVVIVVAILYVLNDNQASEVRQDLPRPVAVADAAATGGCGVVFWILIAAALGALLLGEATMIAILRGGVQVAGGGG